MLILNGLTLHEVYFCRNMAICEEGEFVEVISAFCYLFAAILTFFRSFHRSGLEQKLTWAFSITSLLFFVRELDMEHLNIPRILITMGTGTGRDVLFVTLYLVLMASVFWSETSRRALNLKTVFRSKVIVVAAIGGVLLTLGSIFEHLHLDSIEEIFEMNGALLILLAAILNERVGISLSARTGLGEPLS
ncbi:MAG: hypothetical protein ACI9NQ_001739 [Paracoccaceae bacterium]|jgi:hypothetical protein